MRKRTRLILFLSLVAGLAAGTMAWQIAGAGKPASSSGLVQTAAWVPRALVPTPRDPWPKLNPTKLTVRSNSALVADQATGQILYDKDADRITPIASISKLMSAMVLLDSGVSLDEPETVTQDDVDTFKNSLSRLPVGWTLTRRELLQLALMASENRAAAALARTFPGGTRAFVAAMNAKAQALGMTHTHFLDPHGPHPDNVSTARDLFLMVKAAYGYDTIRTMTTTAQYQARALNTGRIRFFGNSNYLIYNDRWSIGLSKTGFINESGFCLVMEAQIMGRPVAMIFLDSAGKHTRQGDAARVRQWLESGVSDVALGHHLQRPHHAG